MKLEDLEAIARDATPGPWVLDEEAGTFKKPGVTVHFNGSLSPGVNTIEDLKFQVAAREAILPLIRIAKAAKQVAKRHYPTDIGPWAALHHALDDFDGEDFKL